MSNTYIKSDKKNKKYLVIEQTSELKLKSFKEYIEAKQFAKLQNNGGGFNGHTPPFVLNDISGYLK